MELKEVHAKLSNMKLKDLKRACIIRNIDFFYLMELDAFNMQTWLIDNWDNPIIKSRVRTFDEWFKDNLELMGYIEEGEFPDKLKLAQIRVKKDYLPESLRESPEEILHYRPKEGTPKEKVFKYIQLGYDTKTVIASLHETDPEITVGSIKVWASKARKQQREKQKQKQDVK